MANTHEALVQKAKELGLPTNSGIYKPKDQVWSELEISDWELYRRIKNEERHRREHRLWKVALISMIFAVLSALAAWWAILRNPGLEP